MVTIRTITASPWQQIIFWLQLSLVSSYSVTVWLQFPPKFHFPFLFFLSYWTTTQLVSQALNSIDIQGCVLTELISPWCPNFALSFSYKSNAKHPRFYGFRVLGSLQFPLEHSLVFLIIEPMAHHTCAVY